jgi:Flp pilus assembly protein TadD
LVQDGGGLSTADEHHARGYALRKAGEFRGAIEEYSAALRLDPRHFKALFNRGFSHDKVRRSPSSAIAT